MKFLNIFKKRKMDFNLEDLKKEYSGYDFQWIKGENIGNSEEYKDVVVSGNNIPFVEFQTGARIKVSLVNEYMTKHPSSTRPMTDNLLNKKPTNSNLVDRDLYKVSINQETPQLPEKSSPIHSLLSKQKSNVVEVNIKIKINIPPKELYHVLCDSFENAEDEIVEFCTKDIDLDQIKESISHSLRSMYASKKQKQNEEV
jgi:hypothetical protein